MHVGNMEHTSAYICLDMFVNGFTSLVDKDDEGGNKGTYSWICIGFIACIYPNDLLEYCIGAWHAGSRATKKCMEI